MAKIKRLVLGLIPNQKCNLKCDYCYISQVNAWDEPTALEYSPKYIANCLSVERLGGVSLINLTGNGETMLQPDIADLTYELLKTGHYVEIVTNGTVTNRILETLKKAGDMADRLEFKISFHCRELLRLNIMDRFFDNVKAIQKAGASFTLELLAHDELETEIEAIKQLCLDNVGAVCHATIGRNDKRKDKALLSQHSNEAFHEIWKALDSDMLDFKLEMIGQKRREFCYAGDWSFFVNLYTGEAQPCYWQPYNQNIFAHPDQPILFKPVGHCCSQPYCVNAHAHLTWGLIPEMNTPTYKTMRDRTCANGDHWLSPAGQEFFSSKLCESNTTWTGPKKFGYTIVAPFRYAKWFSRNFKKNIARIKNYLRRQ